MPVTTIDHGQHSHIADAREVLARSAAEWTKVWREHAPTQPLPAIDFATSMVAAVFLGARRTGGFDVEITGTESQGRTLVVTYRANEPARSAPGLQVLTSPYHIIRIPRHDGPVRFSRVP
jgi:hypothetical protein